MKKTNISLVASFLLATNLYSQTTTLETITVTSATKSEQKLKDVTANVDVITAEDIEARKFKTVAEAFPDFRCRTVSDQEASSWRTSCHRTGMSYSVFWGQKSINTPIWL